MCTRIAAIGRAALLVATPLVASWSAAPDQVGRSAELDLGSALRTQCSDLVVDLGERTPLLRHGQLGLTHFPDRGVVTLARSPELRLLVAAKFSTHLVGGPRIQELESAVEVLRPGERSEFDNGYAGISGVVGRGDSLFAFYHAEDHEGLPKGRGGLPSFYASVGVAVSSDAGRTWKKLGAAITSAKPKTWSAYATHFGRGAGFPSVVTDPSGRYLLLYYNDLSHVDRRGVQIFLARADLSKGAPLPGQFLKFHDGAFSEPGLGGRDTPVVSALALDESAAVQPFVIRVDSLGEYVLFFHVQAWKENPELHRPSEAAGRRSGLYVATSRDGVVWGTPCRLFADRAFPELGKSLSWETGVVQDRPNGDQGWLVYGYTPSWGRDTPHAMVGRRIHLTRPSR